MKNYKYATWITLLLWIFPLVFYIISDCVDNEFWKNIFIALFGSAILSFITSAIAYRQQRKDTLEKFYNRTNEILHIWSKYFYLDTTEEKLDFFLEYCDFSRYEWDEAYGDMDFFFDRFRRKRKCRQFVFEKIYKPIWEVSEIIDLADRERYLREYKRGVENKGIFDLCDSEFKRGINKYLMKEDEEINLNFQLEYFRKKIMYRNRG